MNEKQFWVSLLPGEGWIDIPGTDLQIETRLPDIPGKIWIRKNPQISSPSSLIMVAGRTLDQVGLELIALSMKIQQLLLELMELKGRSSATGVESKGTLSE